MRQYIVFSDEEIDILKNGGEVSLRTNEGTMLYFMKRDAFASTLTTGEQPKKPKKEESIDRNTALRVLNDISRYMRPTPYSDPFGNKILEINSEKFEAVRKEYLG